MKNKAKQRAFILMAFLVSCGMVGMIALLVDFFIYAYRP